MDIESIIKKIVDHNFSTFEQERLTVLNALMGNIDILMNRSEEWFGDKIPEEYSRVIRSLFSLSAFLLEKKQSSFELSGTEKYHEICIHRFLKQFVSELRNILDFGEMHITVHDEEQELMIRSSETILREAFYNIFFSVYPFMKQDSSCRINLDKSRLNISMEFIFEKLSEAFPGISEIKKNVYRYRQGVFDKVGIGIDSAIASLRGAGAIVRINELPFKDRFSLSIMFPALDFYTGLERVRGDNFEPAHTLYSGEIALYITDPFMKLFMTDALHEYGYNIIYLSSEDSVFKISSDPLKAVVVEYSDETAEQIQNLLSEIPDVSRKIMITNQNDILAIPFPEGLKRIIKPFNIEELIDQIENE